MAGAVLGGWGGWMAVKTVAEMVAKVGAEEMVKVGWEVVAWEEVAMEGEVWAALERVVSMVEEAAAVVHA